MGAQPGADGLLRCPWALSSPDYLGYHDHEWGRPVHGDQRLFERLTLEAFQSGLSWLTILRKREAFRAAFDDFSPQAVAAYRPDRVAHLLADAGIVRNRAKIEAAVANAQATVALGEGGLEALVWAHAPVSGPAPATLAQVRSTTGESRALATALKRAGFRFVGPTTAYALMQACGLVDDHLVGCVVRTSAPGPRTGAPHQAADLGGCREHRRPQPASSAVRPTDHAVAPAAPDDLAPARREESQHGGHEAADR